jgi:tetratricopeptide (TPR) repeat protein
MRSERQDALASPYRGIHPFRYVDQAYFFGREETVTELLAKVLVSRLVLLFGESGTGKSSLINAGLIPALKKEGLNPERLRVRPIPKEPILIERIQSRDEDDGRFLPSIFADDKPAETSTESQVTPCSLERFLKTIRDTDAYPVLIFDQFEELFTLFAQDRDKAAREEALRADLLEAIFQIVNDESLRVKVVITIREDFLGKLEILAKNYPKVFDYRVRLGHLDQDGARKAILGPFENTNPFPSRLTPELAERIIQDLSNSQPNVQIQSPQLQIICSRLWEEYAPTKSEITVEEFEELGEVKGIIEGFLESELGGVEPALKSHAIKVLDHLITESGTRDDVSIDKVRGLIISEGISQDELSLTLAFLEKRRLVNRTHRRQTDYYELANEYLIKPIQLALEQELAETERRARTKVMRWARYIGLVALLIIGGVASTALWQCNVAVEEGNARATAQAAATQEALQSQKTATAAAAVVSAATTAARETATAQAQAEETAAAQATATAQAEAIIAAQATATAQAKATIATQETATAQAEATIAAQATTTAQAAAIIAAEATARAQAEATATASAQKEMEARSFLSDADQSIEQGDYDQAIADCNRAIELAPDLAAAYHKRGFVHAYHLYEYEKAIADYDRAIELDPKHKWAYGDKGCALRELGRYDEALAALDQAIQLDPDFAWAYNERGRVYSEIEEYERAIEDYDKAIEFAPEYKYAYAHKGYALRKLGRYDEALTALDQAIQLDPEYAWPYTERGNVHSERGEYEWAIEEYDKAIKLDPEYKWAYGNKGYALRKLGRYDEALAALDQAIELDPEYADAYLDRGLTYEQLGEQEKAITDLEKFRSLSKDEDLRSQVEEHLKVLRGQ